MKVLALISCMVLNALVVTGFRAPGKGRYAFRGAATLSLSHCSVQRCLPAHPVRRKTVLPVATVMKVESAPDPDRYRGALTTTALAVSGAIAFGAGINQVFGTDKAVQYFAGYVVEMSLSVDNLFVFLLLFRFFKVRAVLLL